MLIAARRTISNGCSAFMFTLVPITYIYKPYTRRHDKQDVMINAIFVEKTDYYCQGTVKNIEIKNNDCVPEKIVFKMTRRVVYDYYYTKRK